MIVDGHVDVYKARYTSLNKNPNHQKNENVIVLKITTSPVGWISGLWSYIPRLKEYQLDISVCSSGLTSLGTSLVKIDNFPSHSSVNLYKPTCEEDRNLIWHPSGQKIAIIERGVLIIVLLEWIDKLINSKISMTGANEIYSNMEEDMVINECISVNTTTLQQLYIGASALTAFHTEDNLILGTIDGFVRIINWEGECINQSSILSENISSSQDRCLFRTWKQASYPMHSKTIAAIGALTPQSQENKVSDDIDTNSNIPPSTSSSIKSLHFDEKTQVLITLFADGSFKIGMLHSGTLSRVDDSSNDEDGLANLLFTVKIHPISLVAYPLSALSNDKTKQLDPSIYELTSSFYSLIESFDKTHADASSETSIRSSSISNNEVLVYRSKDYITSYDVENLLDLSPSLLSKVCRIKSLVTGTCVEEMGNVLEFRVLDGERESSLQNTATLLNGGSEAATLSSAAALSIKRRLKVLMLIGTKHIPDSITLDDERLCSISLMLLDINISSVSTSNHTISSLEDKTVQCKCTQSVCINKSQRFSIGNHWELISHHLELINTSRNNISGLCILTLVSGIVDCRLVQALHSVIFTIDTNLHYNSIPMELCDNIVSMSISLGKIIISVWNHEKKEVIETCDSSKIFLISTISSASCPIAGSSQSQGYFVDFNDGSLKTCLGNHCSRESSSCNKKGMKTLKLPRSLVSNIMHYQQLSAISNPFLRTRISSRKSSDAIVQDGLLVASSKQSKATFIEKEIIEECKYSPFTKCKAFGSGNYYLALVAGGRSVPIKGIRKLSKEFKSLKQKTLHSKLLLLWIYNAVTRRWRSTHLDIGNEFSNAVLIQDIASYQSTVAEIASYPIEQVVNDFDPLLGDFQSNLPQTPRAISKHQSMISSTNCSDRSMTELFCEEKKMEQIRNKNIPITSKSHLSGDVYAVIAVSWFGDHTILLITLRKSLYCFEILTREVTRSSLSVGKPHPLVHKIIQMPPGYSPSILETRVVNIKEEISHSSGITMMKSTNTSCKLTSNSNSFDNNFSEQQEKIQNDFESESNFTQNTEIKSHLSASISENCLTIVSDGRHFICYQISKQYKGYQNYFDNFHIIDYFVMELWEVKLSDLSPYHSIPPCFEKESIRSSQSHQHIDDIALPIQEIHMFVQNSPLHVHEVKEFHNRSEITASMMLLDGQGKVIFVNPVNKFYHIINKGPIYRILQVNKDDILQPIKINENIPDEFVTATPTESFVSKRSLFINKLNNCFLFYMIDNKLVELHENLIKVFRKVKLLKKFGRIPENVQIETSKIWLSFETIEEDSEEMNLELQMKKNLLQTSLMMNFDSLQTINNLEVIDGEIYHYGYSSSCLKLSNISNLNSSQLDYNPYRVSLASYIFNSLLSNLIKRIIGNDANELDLNPSFGIEVDIKSYDILLENQSHDLVKSKKEKSEYETVLLESILSFVLNSIHSKCRTAANFLTQLELDAKNMIENITKTKHSNEYFSILTSYLSSNNSLLLCELISRLGRKLEPSISKHLYPFSIDRHYGTDNISSIGGTAAAAIGVITMFESCLSANPPQFHHAARTLSLACESLGGTEHHLTTISSLVFALELFYQTAMRFSLRNALECFEFCLRLESLLVIHHKLIDTDVSSDMKLFNISYLCNLKQQALNLIKKERKRCNKVYKNKLIDNTDRKINSNTQSLLPYFFEVSINWLFGQSGKSGKLNDGNEESLNKIIKSYNDTAYRNNNNTNNNNNNNNKITTKSAVQCMKEMISSNVEFSYHAFNAIDKEYDSLKSLSSTTSEDNEPSSVSEGISSYNSSTIILVILILKEFMSNEAHYLKVAVFMSALLSSSSTAANLIISYFSIVLFDKKTCFTNENSSSTSLNEKMRRILYVFGLNRSFFSDKQHMGTQDPDQLTTNQLLQQRINPQYIRRIIEADGKKNDGNSSGYFELIDDMLNISSATIGVNSLPNSNYFENKLKVKNNEDSLALLKLLKSLLLGLLLVGDYSMAMLLLKVIHKGLSGESTTAASSSPETINNSMLYINIDKILKDGEMTPESLIRLIKVIVGNIN